MPVYKTAGQIIKQAAIDLGLGDWDDPFGADDPIAKRLCSYFNNSGKDVMQLHPWGQLKALWEFTTADGDTGNYLLPDDWREMLPQTGWDRTKRMPMGGPLSSQEWAYLRAWQMGVTLTALFRLERNELMLYPQPPPSGILVSLEYLSASWLVPDAKKGVWQTNHYNSLGSAGLTEAIESTDICLLDDFAMQQRLKLWWRREVGMDTAAAREDFLSALDNAKSRASAPPTLSINGPRLGIPNVHLIDGSNVPPTGYGR